MSDVYKPRRLTTKKPTSSDELTELMTLTHPNIPVTFITSPEQAGSYTLDSDPEDNAYLICLNSSGGKYQDIDHFTAVVINRTVKHAFNFDSLGLKDKNTLTILLQTLKDLGLKVDLQQSGKQFQDGTTSTCGEWSLMYFIDRHLSRFESKSNDGITTVDKDATLLNNDKELVKYWNTARAEAMEQKDKLENE